MPKLSTYVSHTGETPPAPASPRRHRPPPTDAAGALAAAEHLAAVAGAHSAPRVPLQRQAQQGDQQQGLEGSLGQLSLDPQHAAAATKLQADYARRVREHGPRTFRWPDGSLRPEKPPPSPHAVANRQQWAELVQHCRTAGGDRAFEREGQSLRYCLGVSHQQHAAYLAHIGLEPEADAGGELKGRVAGLPAPLDDPQHCFNTYYKEGAAAVFRDARGRLL
ncbi:hypothetical protein ACK3TF_000712 [Chlorella vulgaris]